MNAELKELEIKSDNNRNDNGDQLADLHVANEKAEEVKGGITIIDLIPVKPPRHAY